MGRLTFWVLLGLTLFAVSSNDILTNASDVGPSESECRPYIEKAINELKTGEPSDTEVPSPETTSVEDGGSTNDDEQADENSAEMQSDQPAEPSDDNDDDNDNGEDDNDEDSADSTTEVEGDNIETVEIHDVESTEDSAPRSKGVDLDGDGIPNEQDSDIDGDNIEDEEDEDMDGDGILNVHDDDIDGDSIENTLDPDIDGDGVANAVDSDLDGDGVDNTVDPDLDGDGVENAVDPDLDGDGIHNAEDTDLDGDGIPNEQDEDVNGVNVNGQSDDDGDGIPNHEDDDIDGDGLPNEDEPKSLDIDGDGILNVHDDDVDGDNIDNTLDPDIDGDGVDNADDADIDGDGVANAVDADIDGDGVENAVDVDIDGDGVANIADTDMDGDGVANAVDADIDGDGVANVVDADMDGDGLANAADADMDGDGLANVNDSDSDGDGIPNEQEEESIEEEVVQRAKRSLDTESAAADDETSAEESDKNESNGEVVDEKDDDDNDDDNDDNDDNDNNDDNDDEEDIKPEDELLWEGEVPVHRRSREHLTELLQLNEEFNAREKAVDNVAEIILRDIKRIYESAIKPLETLYKYRDLSNRHFGDPEIFSKPLILFMGPWSGGKSTILNYLTNNEYTSNSLRTGAEPSPAYFNILMWGNETEVLDGTQLAADYTFSGLQKFGQGLEDRLRGLKIKSKLLEKVNIVEIPGILEVRKQVQRLFPFNDACQWFIDRADIIFLVYDPAKLDVGPETEAILDQLKGREYQTRIVLNKADTVKPEELLRVQSALIWNISPLMSSAQPPLVYTTSLWSHPYQEGAPARLLLAQERAFLRDLRTAIEKRIEHKIASARRFAVRVRNHAKMVDCYLNTYYNHKTLFGNKKRIADDIVDHPQNYHIYEGLSTLTNISRYDLPDPEVYRDFFRLNPLFEFKKLSETCTYFRGCPITKLDVAIAYDLPELAGKYKKMAESALSAIDAREAASESSSGAGGGDQTKKTKS